MSQEGGYHGALWLVTALSPGLECFPGVSQGHACWRSGCKCAHIPQGCQGEKKIFVNPKLCLLTLHSVINLIEFLSLIFGPLSLTSSTKAL